MARNNMQIQRLREERQRLAAEMQALKHRIEGLDLAISLLDGEQPAQSRRSRTSLKETVLGLLNTHREAGLSATEIVELAAGTGIELDRNSVSSLLSRLKKDGVLTLDRSKYRVREGDSSPVVELKRLLG